MEQERIDRIALEAAIGAAEEGLRAGGIPIGAALVDGAGNVVATGCNLRVQQGDPTAHGETSCIRNAGRRRDWHTLTMGTTLSPCAMCSGTAVLLRLKRVVIGESRNFRGREDWLREAGIQVRVMEDPRCIKMMETFIREHADLWNEDIGDPEEGTG